MKNYVDLMCKRDNIWRIDGCMTNLIKFLNWIPGLLTLGSCCGHGKYHMTIIARFGNSPPFENLSGRLIPRKRRFYVRDKEG